MVHVAAGINIQSTLNKASTEARPLRRKIISILKNFSGINYVLDKHEDVDHISPLSH